MQALSGCLRPYRKYLIDVEKVQKRATKLVKESKNVSYEERLREI